MITFIYPVVLYILLPLSLVLIFLMLTNKDKIERVFAPQVLNRLKTQGKGLGRKSRDILLSIAIILIVIALSRPVIFEDYKKYEQRYNVLLAFDISRSMFSKDIYPNRFEFAKQKAIELLQHRGSINYAVALFDQSSYLIAPMTPNHAVLEDKLQNLEVSIKQQKADFKGIFEKADYFFEKTEKKTVVLFSDGASSTDFQKLRDYLEKAQIEVLVFMVGTVKGAPLLDAQGKPLHQQWSRLDKDIAAISTLGRAQLLQSNTDLHLQLQRALKNATASNKQTAYARYNSIELFKPLLATALILIFISSFSFPKRVTKLWIVVLFFIAPDLKAGVFDFQTIQKAHQAYEQQKYADAIKEFAHLPKSAQRDYNIANSYYKLQQYAKAIEYYKEVQTDKKDLTFKTMHNLGNSYFQQKKYEAAIKSYTKALEFKKDPQTEKNLKTAKKMLQNSKKKQQAAKKSSRGQEKKEQEKAEQTAQNKQSQTEQNNTIEKKYKRYDRMLYKPKTQIIKIGD